MNPNYYRVFSSFATALIPLAALEARETERRVHLMIQRLGILASLSFQHMGSNKDPQDTNKPQIDILCFSLLSILSNHQGM